MRPAYGTALGEHILYLPAVDFIAERDAFIHYFQSTIQPTLFEPRAVVHQVFLAGMDIIAQNMDIFSIVITAHFNSRNDPYPRSKGMPRISSDRIMVGNDHDRQPRLYSHLCQLFRRIQTIGTSRMHMQIYFHTDPPPLSHSRTVLIPVPVAPI